MKKLISLFVLFSTLSFAGTECPQLAGSYHCMISRDQYSLLKIEQTQITEDLVHYRFDYTAIPGDPEVIAASSQGEPGEMGWTTRCADNRLRSLLYDATMMQEMYLDKDQALVRVLNGVVKQRCPKKFEDQASLSL